MRHKKFIQLLLGGLVVMFLFSYFIGTTGYYEYNLQNKKNLTEEQILSFEKDVAEGKEIDLNMYLKETGVDYSNKLTRTTSEVSIKVNNFLKNFLADTFHLLEKLVK